MLLWFGVILLVGGMVLILVFLLGGCNEIPGSKLEDTLGLSCCRRQQSEGADEMPLCRSKLKEEALEFLVGGVLAMAFSFLFLVYSRKYFYQLDYAFFDWK